MDICTSVAPKLAECMMVPVWRPFSYLIHYESNLERLTAKVKRLTERKSGLELERDAATNNLETIAPEVESWLRRVDETMQEKDKSFGEEGIPKPRCFNGRCPNVKSRYRLSKRAKKMTLAVEKLLEEGNFQKVSYPAPPPDIGFASTEATSELHEQGTSSGTETINPALPEAPLGPELEYKLPYTKEVLGALHNDNINMIGICGIIEEGEAVTVKEFMRRVSHLFEEVVMAVLSSNPELERIQGEIAEMLRLRLEEGSLLERAEKLHAMMSTDSKRFLVILADVWKMHDLEALGIPHIGRSQACKIIMMSQQVNAFRDIRAQGNFKLILGGMSIGMPIAFPSRNLIFRHVMDALKDDQVNPVVICGLGGIGKTTMIKEVGERAKAGGLFDEVVMAVVTKTPKLKRIQFEIADFLGLVLVEQSVRGRARKLYNRLSTGKRVLVILDDVWTRLDLEEVGIPFGCGQKGCKILVSSRNQDIFSEKKTKRNFTLGVLPEEEAWSLFKEMAGGCIESPELRPIAQRVLNECAGLPIAVLTVGRALRHKSKQIWNDALRQLRKSSPDHIPGMIQEVYRKIEFSYECLGSEEAKSLLLLCCLYPEGVVILVEDLIRWGLGLGLFKDIDSFVEGRNSVVTLVDILKNCFLLLDSNKAGCVKMHDVVRDVAFSIASQGRDGFLVKHGLELNDWPMEVDDEKLYTTRTMITSKSCGLDNWRDNTKTELLLMACLKDLLTPPPSTILSGMEELKVLDIRRTNMESIPTSVLLLKDLQMLCLEDCELETLAILGELRTLQILSLRGSWVTELPSEIGNLTNLRLLDLTGCKSIDKISPGVISSLAQLEELYMRDCFSWCFSPCSSLEMDDMVKHSVINSGLLSLRRLTTLEIILPPFREFLHNRLLFEKLERFEISVHRNVIRSGLWDANPGEDGFRLDFSTRDMFNPNISAKFRRHDMGVDFLTRDMFNPSGSAEVGRNDIDARVGSEIMVLQKRAETIKLDGLYLREAFNVSDGECFPNLKSLTLKSCSGLAYLVDMTMVAQSNIFPVLHSLKIHISKSLREICHGQLLKGSFKELRELSLSGLSSLTHLWRAPTQSQCLGNLRRVKMSRCGSIKCLFLLSIASDLGQLEELDVLDCSELEQIVAMEEPGHGGETNDIKFPSLICLKIDNLPKFVGIVKNVSGISFPQLIILKIEHLRKLVSLCPNNSVPESSSTADTVQYLLNPKVKSFGQLQFMVVGSCDKLSRVFSFNLMKNLQNLEELEVRSCRSLTTLFDFDGVDVKEMDAAETLSCLEKMELIELPYLADVWKPPQNILAFRNLKSLHVERCARLRNVFPAYIDELLVKLESIYISDCDMLKEFIAKHGGSESDERALTTIVFPQVKATHLVKLPDFTSLYPSPCTIDWPTLTTLVLSCPKMKTFVPSSVTHAADSELPSHLFNDKVRFPVLETLELRKMPNFKEIWSDQILPCSFCDLNELNVSDCSQLLLVFPFHMENRLQKIERLTVTGCGSLKQVFECGGFNESEGHVDVVTISRSSETQGFQNLTSISIFHCHSLKNLLPYSIAKGLVKLKTLWVASCEKMEAIVVKPVEGEETVDDKSLLPQLSCLKLSDLPTLASFSQWKVNSFGQLRSVVVVQDRQKLSGVFSSNLMQNLQNLVELEVTRCRSLKTLFDFGGVDVKEMGAAETLSCLEKMELTDLPYLADVWKPTQNILAFRNLKSLQVERCATLRNVFPAFIAELLVKLRSIYINVCDMLREFIAKNEGGESDKKALIPIVFPQVKTIHLAQLPDFTSFYPSPCTVDRRTLKTFVPSSVTHAADDQLLSHMFDEKIHFPVLETLELHQMCNLKEIWSDQILAGSFCDLKDLHVSRCAHLLLVFPFNMQSRLQKLERLNVKRCDSLEQVFESRGFDEGEGHVDVVRIPRTSETQGFQNLTSISIFCCDSLKNLLPYSIAKGLVKLKSLSVEYCKKIEEIVVKPAEGEETGDDKSLLSQLSNLNLTRLPTLASFSQGKVCFEWPLLTGVTIDFCEEMKTFSLGLVTTPRLQQVRKINGSYRPWMGDLNSTIQHLFNERPGTSDH